MARESINPKRESLLVDDGWQKIFEEVLASGPEKALARVAEVRKEEDMTEHACITESALSGRLRAILPPSRNPLSAT